MPINLAYLILQSCFILAKIESYLVDGCFSFSMELSPQVLRLTEAEFQSSIFLTDRKFSFVNCFHTDYMCSCILLFCLF